MALYKFDFMLCLCYERAFSHAGPAAWNALPQNIRANQDREVFLGNSSKLIFYLSF